MSQPFDQSIPVLTEVFSDRDRKPPAPVPVPAPVLEEELIQDEAPPDADAIGAQLATLATDSWTESEWRLLEQRVAGRVLQQLDARIDATLDNQLRDSLADVLQFAMASLTVELRAGLQRAIQDTVTQAVAYELAQLKNPHRN
ncbi:hypothetical protein [Massilia sp. S19_KUP03_FR1]|uniref:hypothetical protein n=1 Tax=Massilia sp. S19_KUP03_FR1 TaxID=3025503 RepID=UPI002FCD9DCF